MFFKFLEKTTALRHDSFIFGVSELPEQVLLFVAEFVGYFDRDADKFIAFASRSQVDKPFAADSE